MDHGKAKKLVDAMEDHHKVAYENLITSLENNILAFQEPNFANYTDHSLRHSHHVAELLASMIARARKSLNSLEILVLLCSAWLHDIGMLWNKIRPDQKLDPFEVRGKHHELSRTYVRENWKILLPSLARAPSIAGRISDICFCHRRFIDINEIFPEEFISIGADDRVRAKLAAALLRLADSLDTDTSRAPELIIDISGLNEESKREWQKCRLVEGISFDADKKLTITISSRRIDNNVDRNLFLEKCKEIYTEFCSVREILLQNQIRYPSMTLQINDVRLPRARRTLNASDQFPNPVPSWEILQSAANKTSQRIINEMSSIGKYDNDLYITREEVEACFHDFINSDKVGFVLVGLSGVGKTNLFCHLSREYKKENIVILYNGAFLPAPDIERLIEKDLEGYCLKQALDIALKSNKYLIILIDGLNDYSDPESLLRHINDVIGRINNPRLKVAFSCRNVLWNMLFDYERIALYRTQFFSPEGRQAASLQEFTREELARVYPLYKKRFELSTNLDYLSEETKEMLRDPLILRLVCETYKGEI